MRPAQTEVKWTRHGAIFHQVCGGTGGYAYEFDVEIKILDNTLALVCRLTNTGIKPLSTEQYVHNFFQFGDQTIGPGYEVEFPYDFEVTIPKPVIERQGNTLVFNGPVTEAMKAATAVVIPRNAGTLPDFTMVRHAPSGMSLRTSVSRPTSSTTVHAAPRYICPEQFVRVRLQPKEIEEWTRTYTFEIR